MEKTNIIDTLREAVNYLKDNKVTYEDENGNQLTLAQAMSQRVFVRPVDGRVKAQELLSSIGLDITQNSVKNLLAELVSLAGGSAGTTTSTSSKARLSQDEKKSLVEEFRQSGSKNKRKFTEEKGIGYQSFLKWEKEFA
ncbi:MAG TPA: hypothetical protein VK014_14470 [Cyclobacteriaceae bacterium]|nr:hypothetical protein [Cyclobacteriaceae bacterium]